MNMSAVMEPRIRIAGYKKDWHKKPFGEMVMRSSASSVSPFLPHIEYEDIVSGRGYLNKDPLDKINSIKQGLLFQPGDLLFGKLRAYLQNNFLATFQGIAVGDFWVLRPKENGSFLFNLIKTEQFQKIANTSIGTKMPRSDWGLVSSADYYIPEIDEQKEIAHIIDSIEISIHKCELELLKLTKTKKAYLSMLFPRSGEKKPRLRFKGFTEEWVKKKLGECFTERPERSTNGELLSVTQSSGIKRFSEIGRHDNSNIASGNYKVVKCGDIAYNSMRMWQGASGWSPYDGIVSPAYTVIVPKENVSSRFFSFLFKKPEIIHLFRINSQGLTSDTWNLKFPAFSQIEVYCPDSFEEQNEIANFLMSIDTLISTHSRRLEKFRHIKSACLDGMFVNE